MADEYAVSLYDANGMYVADALTDQDLSVAANRENVIDSNGKIYVWNQRNNQWRESSGVITLSKKDVEAADAEPEPAIETTAVVKTAEKSK